jgi:hypothetical protein
MLSKQMHDVITNRYRMIYRIDVKQTDAGGYIEQMLNKQIQDDISNRYMTIYQPDKLYIVPELKYIVWVLNIIEMRKSYG